MQMRLLGSNKAIWAAACLGMSAWGACDTANPVPGRAQLATQHLASFGIDGGDASSSGTGGTDGMPSASDGGYAGVPSAGGVGGMPAGGAGGMPAGGAGGMPAGGVSGMPAGGVSGAGTGGVGGAAGTGGATGDEDAGVPPGDHGRHGRRSPPPPKNRGPSAPAVVGEGASSSCATSLTIRFKGVVGAQPFACGQSYPDQGSQSTTVTPQDFRFFVQNLALIRTDGTRVPVDITVRAPWQSKTVALLDFEDHKGACTAGNTETNTEITGTVPAGTYTGLSFTTGVPEDLNHADVATLSDPLQRYKDLSWGPPMGYRFVVAELLQEPDEGTGRGVFHLSSSDCNGDPVSCAKPNRNDVVLDHFNVCSDVVLADIGEIFAYTHLGQLSACTPDGQFCDPMYSAVGVDYDTGEPLEGQTAFRKQ